MATKRNAADKYYVTANHDRLGYGWQWDPMMREEVYRKIKALHRQGWTAAEIATDVGCSDRTVNRWIKRA